MTGPVSAPLDPVGLNPVLEENLSEARTLPVDAYLSPGVLAWEREHLFEAAWVCVGRSDQIAQPGDQKAIRVGTQGILLTRDQDGRAHAFHNTCRHRGHELLAEGACANRRAVSCPYHAWVYGLDGELRSATRFMDTQNFDTKAWPLLPLGVTEWFGWLFVNASGDAPGFQQWVGNLTEVAGPWLNGTLVTGATHTYTRETNWKLVLENYLECYHCPSIHPELCRVSPPETARGYAHTGMWIGGPMELRDEAQTMSLDGRSGGERIPGLTDEQARRVTYFSLAPNLLITLQPDYVMTHRLTPLSPGRTVVECSWLFPEHVATRPDFDPSFASDFWDITNEQDLAACESVYRGMQSEGFRPGPFDEREDAVRAFQAQVAEAYLTGRWGKAKVNTMGTGDLADAGAST
ncbi:aromatic ring-hydroxylating dioxygenase subunit alpha [Streptomyces scabiei]|uniref:aromatic ring-hydroxylating oxygenase subunit alpha n=1 Tax=Streptomyces scabiei TaxID=1930 RepID=UPI0036C75365